MLSFEGIRTDALVQLKAKRNYWNSSLTGLNVLKKGISKEYMLEQYVLIGGAAFHEMCIEERDTAFHYNEGFRYLVCRGAYQGFWQFVQDSYIPLELFSKQKIRP